MPSCSPQFQFINSYLSLFYIGFYLKDMERLKEVRPWPEAVVPMCLAGDWVWPKASMGSLAPPPSILFSSLSVRPSMCPLSACHPPHLSVCLSIGPFTAPAHPVPVPEPRAAASGSAGPAHGPEVPPAPPLPSGPPAPGPGQSMGRWRAPGAGSVALLGASCQAEGACCGEMVLHWLGAGGRGPSSPQAHWLLQAGWPQVLGKSGWECCGWEQANSGRGCRGWGLCPGTSRRAS